MNNFSGFDHLAPARDRQLVSVGYLCGLLQILPGQLRVLMEDCEVKFAEVRDGVGYVLVADAETLAAKNNELREEIRAVETSFERN